MTVPGLTICNHVPRYPSGRQPFRLPRDATKALRLCTLITSTSSANSKNYLEQLKTPAKTRVSGLSIACRNSDFPSANRAILSRFDTTGANH